jgi:hypothetical protein
MPSTAGGERANIGGMVAGGAEREAHVTKSKEKGENEITTEARRRAAIEGRHVCEVLSEMLKAAKRQKDKPRAAKIKKAQKYLKCRNRRKRESEN